MKKKLTLSIDDKVLRAIKKKSERQGWIISKRVENFFISLLKGRKQK